MNMHYSLRKLDVELRAFVATPQISGYVRRWFIDDQERDQVPTIQVVKDVRVEVRVDLDVQTIVAIVNDGAGAIYPLSFTRVRPGP